MKQKKKIVERIGALLLAFAVVFTGIMPSAGMTVRAEDTQPQERTGDPSQNTSDSTPDSGNPVTSSEFVITVTGENLYADIQADAVDIQTTDNPSEKVKATKIVGSSTSSTKSQQFKFTRSANKSYTCKITSVCYEKPIEFTINAMSNETSLEQNFNSVKGQNVKEVTVKGTVVNDENTPVVGVTVTPYYAEGNVQIGNTLTTDNNGSYNFKAVCGATVKVQVTDCVGYIEQYKENIAINEDGINLQTLNAIKLSTKDFTIETSSSIDNKADGGPVLAENAVGGTIELSGQYLKEGNKVQEGKEVTYTIKPELGYLIKSYTVDGKEEQVTDQNSDEITYTITPQNNISISAVFVPAVHITFDKNLVDNVGGWADKKIEIKGTIQSGVDLISKVVLYGTTEELKIDNGNPPYPVFVYADTTEGSSDEKDYRFTVTLNDAQGTTNDFTYSTKQKNIMIDTNAPTITGLNPSNPTYTATDASSVKWYKGEISVGITAEDQISGVKEITLEDSEGTSKTSTDFKMTGQSGEVSATVEYTTKENATGTVTLTAKAEDYAGHKTLPAGFKSVAIYYDNKAPEISALKTDNPFCGDSGKIVLNPTAGDEGSGLAKYRYVLCKASEAAPTGCPDGAKEVVVGTDTKITLNADEFIDANAEYICYVWAVDNVGNISVVKASDKLQKDTISPEITFKFDKKVSTWTNIKDFLGIYSNSTVIVTVTAKDENGSGFSNNVFSDLSYKLESENKIRKISAKADSFKRNDDGTVSVAYEMTVDEDQIIQAPIYVSATDAVGNTNKNVAATKENSKGVDSLITDNILIMLEEEKPEITFKNLPEIENIYKDGNDKVWYKGDQTITVSGEVRDTHSGIWSVTAKLNGQETDVLDKNAKLGNQGQITNTIDFSKGITMKSAKDDGEITLTADAVDNASNNADTKSVTFYFDGAAPVIADNITFNPVYVEGNEEATVTRVTPVVDLDYGYFFNRATEAVVEVKDYVKDSPDHQGAGVKAVYYQLVAFDQELGDDWTEAVAGENDTYTFGIDAGFKGTIYLKAVDQVNNWTEDKNVDGMLILENEKQHKDNTKASLTLNKTDYTDINDPNHKVPLYNENNKPVVTMEAENGFMGIASANYTRNVSQTSEVVKKFLWNLDPDQVQNDFVDNTESEKNIVTRLSYTDNVVYEGDQGMEITGIQSTLTMKCNAGHEDTTSVIYSYDSLAPRVEVTWDNTDVTKVDKDGTETDYYTEKRVATITVVDRNFDTENTEVTATKSNGSTEPTVQDGWTSVGNDKYTKTIEFTSDGDYSLSFKILDLAGHETDGSEAFSIDTQAPTIYAESISFKSAEPVQRVENPFENGYGYIFNNKTTATVKVTDDMVTEGDDLGSGVKEVQYKLNGMADNKVKEGTGEWKTITAIEGDEYSFEIPGGFKGWIDLRAVDKVYTPAVTNHETVKTITPGFILECISESSECDTVALTMPETGYKDANEYPLYAESPDIYVTANNTFAGLKDVNYSRSNDGKEYEIQFTGNLEKENGIEKNTGFTTVESERNLVTKLQYKDKPGYPDGSAENPGVEITGINVTVKGTCNAGHPDEQSVIYSYDSLAPRVTVEWENNEVREVEGRNYYTAGRKVTITVTERNFNEKDTTVTAEKKNGANAPEIGKWTKKEGVEDTYEKVITFAHDGDYTFSYDIWDLAGHHVTSDEQKNTQEFSIDTKAPVIYAGEISYSVKGTKEEKDVTVDKYGYIFDQNTIATIEVTDDMVKTKDNLGVGVAGVEYYLMKAATSKVSEGTGEWIPITTRTGNNYSFEIKAGFKGWIYFRAIDKLDHQTDNYEDGKPAIPGFALEHVDLTAISLEMSRTPYTDAEGHPLYSDAYMPSFKVSTTNELVGLASALYQRSDVKARGFTGSLKADNGVESNDGFTVRSDVNLVASLNYTDNPGYARDFETSNITLDFQSQCNALHNKKVARQTYSFDSWAPRLTIVWDNNSVLNEKYYKENRTATITVEERNFDESKCEFILNGTKSPAVSGWSHNGDVHTATVSYTEDGDYTFSFRVTDRAGHTTDYGKTDEFTLDKTVPTIQVAFDNNDVRNGRYYKESRIATITVNEHNFNGAEVQTAISSNTVTPGVNGWSTAGDVHTATAAFTEDGDYSFTVNYTDLAGNAATVYEVELFTVDKTVPELEIFDIEDKSANNGEVAPAVRYSDTNYDANGVSITYVGAKHSEKSVDGARMSVPNGESIKMADFDHEVEVDDVYTMNAKVVDLAGNETEKSVIFSVNRFGSNFIFSDETERFLDNFYNNEEETLVVTEINVDTLSHRGITKGCDGKIEELVEGTDYTVKESGAETSWKSYQYTIKKDNFEKEGRYNVTIDSVDRATNQVNNKIKNANIEFIMDKTAPSVVITGVEDGGQYRENEREVVISVTDNVVMNEVEFYVNNDQKPVAVYDAKAITESGGKLSYMLASSTDWQNIKVIGMDAAGNVMDTSSNSEGNADKWIRVLVTSNILVQYYRNTPLFIGSIIALILAIGLVVYLITKKNKKAEDVTQ